MGMQATHLPRFFFMPPLSFVREKDMDPTTTAVIVLFLIIFAATAVLALGSIPTWGWELRPEFRKPIVGFLIIEVAVIVVGFGRTAFRNLEVSVNDLPSAISNRDEWEWQYPEKGWRTRVRFTKTNDGKMTFDANTEVVTMAERPTIIRWHSTKPFEVPKDAKKIVFEAKRVYTQAAAELDPGLQAEVGKEILTQINLRPQLGLRGSATDPNAKAWDMSMTEAW
jgi:hypothetical protein